MYSCIVVTIKIIDSVQFTGDEILFRSTLKRHLTQEWNYSCDKNGTIEKKVNGWDKLFNVLVLCDKQYRNADRLAFYIKTLLSNLILCKWEEFCNLIVRWEKFNFPLSMLRF
jgi:hypothetical protein